MKKRFIIAANFLTPDQERKFARYLAENKLSWWHWVKNYWLVVDKTSNLSCKKFRGEIKKIIGSTSVLVMEISGVNAWAGSVDSSSTSETFDWLDKVWNPDD